MVYLWANGSEYDNRVLGFLTQWGVGKAFANLTSHLAALRSVVDALEVSHRDMNPGIRKRLC